jgi:hypothetical protein
MIYCRALKFEQEPNYKQCIGLFESCLARNNLDGKVFDYTWKQNRLSKDKEALKAQMMGILKKNTNTKKNDQQATEKEGGEAEPTISELDKKKY